MVPKIFIKLRKGLTLIEILVITTLLIVVASLLVNMQTSFARNSKLSAKKSLFESNAILLFEHLKNDLRSVYRSDLSQDNLTLYIRKLNSVGSLDEFGVNYQWNQKQVTRTPETGQISTFNFISFNDNGYINFQLERQLAQNYQIKLEAFDSKGIKWAEHIVIVQILSLSMND